MARTAEAVIAVALLVVAMPTPSHSQAAVGKGQAGTQGTSGKCNAPGQIKKGTSGCDQTGSGGTGGGSAQNTTGSGNTTTGSGNTTAGGTQDTGSYGSGSSGGGTQSAGGTPDTGSYGGGSYGGGAESAGSAGGAAAAGNAAAGVAEGAGSYAVGAATSGGANGYGSGVQGSGYGYGASSSPGGYGGGGYGQAGYSSYPQSNWGYYRQPGSGYYQQPGWGDYQQSSWNYNQQPIWDYYPQSSWGVYRAPLVPRFARGHGYVVRWRGGVGWPPRWRWRPWFAAAEAAPAAGSYRYNNDRYADYYGREPYAVSRNNSYATSPDYNYRYGVNYASNAGYENYYDYAQPGAGAAALGTNQNIRAHRRGYRSVSAGWTRAYCTNAVREKLGATNRDAVIRCMQRGPMAIGL